MHHRTYWAQMRENDLRIPSPNKRCTVILLSGHGQVPINNSFSFFVVPGLINSAVAGIIGSGVVVQSPYFFDEFDTLCEKGKCRLFA